MTRALNEEKPSLARRGLFFAPLCTKVNRTYRQERWMPKPSEDQIRMRAHQLWEAAGKPEGRDREFWIEAERQLTEDVANNSDEKSDTFLE
jgi:hypothetical protein